ncbi:MAG TPA: TIR domain-containing protein [Pseudomonadales bacterium]|nr:TIR domain-containing protein [Pseudomonadales bacterium]
MERPFPAYQGDEPYIFVSYAHDDAALVYPDITRLRSEGFNIWYDEGISPGSTWRDEVALALTQCKLFLYFVSPRSVVSANCLKELNFCLSRERKVLSVHLEKTELPMGLELSLSDMQAIIRADHTDSSYQRKLSDSLRSLLPSGIKPIATPFDKPVEIKSDEKSIAILPLVNRNLDAENDYLCDGISEELINGLVQIEGLRVASRLSAFAFKNQDLDVREMGEKLGVENILSGSVQKSGNRVRISVQLNSVKDGSALWSHRYDQTLDDIFELQDDVAKKVIDALRIELHARDDDKVIDVGTVNTDAYEAYLLGMHELRLRTRRGLDRAIDYFTQAITIDKTFLRAYLPRYICYIQLTQLFGAPREEMLVKARNSIEPA